jgi:hypothetical protein
MVSHGGDSATVPRGKLPGMLRPLSGCRRELRRERQRPAGGPAADEGRPPHVG